MIQELINELNILDEQPNLMVDIGSVLENTDSTVTVESSTKFGRYQNVEILGSYKPKPKDSGLILFVGRYKYPCFLFLPKVSISSGEVVQ